MIGGKLALWLGIDALEFVQAMLLGGRPVVKRVTSAGCGKASYWRTARLALDEIAALVGLATKPKRPPVPERYALQATVMVAMVGKGAP